jgi:PAS domain S-box-containing protein/putative nucleotidyltransferase with HDIG domain
MKQVMGDMKKNHNNLKVGRIMIVDDEAELMTALCEALAGQGYETTGFTTGADALKVLVEQDYDLLLTDLMMPEMDGIALLQAGLEIDPNLVGIIMTGHGTVQTAVEAMKTGAFDYVLKPFKLNALLPLLSRAMEVRSLRMENVQLRETVAIHELGKVIAFSSDLNAILNKVADATLQQCTADEVSIMLPTRDGKELYVAVARGGHREYIGERVPMERGIAGWVARNRETVIINGKVDDPRFSPVNPRTDIRAAVSMPMMAGGNLVGVLNVNITRSHRHMTLGQVKALSILVSIISPILENTWLNIQIRQAEEKYRSIFENAVEGIYQSTSDGAYVTINQAFAHMFGYASPQEMMDEVSNIAKQLYVDPEDRTRMQQLLKTEGVVRGFEVKRCRKNGSHFWVSLNARAMRDEKGNIQYYEGTIEDITHRKKAEMRQALVNEILEALNRPNEIINLIRDILLLLKEHTGIEAIGIRLREGGDFPYYVTNGFPPHFLEAENSLCTRDNAGEIIRDSHGNPCLECMCGNILCGRTDPTFPFFTEGGSFWSNRTTELLASTSEEDRQARTRNRCNSEGYESVALIPLQSGDEIIGLLQLNDSRRDSFSIEMIHFFEGIGATIGIAVARKRAEEERRRMEMSLKSSHNRLKTVLDSLDALVYVTDMNTYEILFINQYGRDIWGDIEGKTCWQTIQVGQTGPCPFCTNDKIVTRDGVPTGIHIWEFQNSVNNNWYKCLDQAISWIDGRLVRMELAYDITEQKLLEETVLRERSLTDRIMKTSPAGITVIDRKGQIVFANKRAEDIFCLTKNEITQRGYNASEWHITDFDGNPFPEEQLPFTQVMNTGNPVYGVRHAIKLSGRQRVFLSINGAPILDDQSHISEVVFTIDDVTEQRKAEEKVKQSLEKIQKTMNDIVRAMSMIVETRDPYTAGHQERVARLAIAIARDLKLSEDQLEGIQVACIIHDIGKMYVPAEILSKPSKLSDIEFSMVRSHAQVGYEILKTIDFPHPVADIVHQHHERMNGSGYPKALSNGAILMEARILAVADVVEAMASHRPYRPTRGIDVALEEIKKNKSLLYDAEVVDACLRLFHEKGYKMEG